MALHTELSSDPLFGNKEEGNEDPMGVSHQEPIEETTDWPSLTEDLWEYLLQK